MSEFIKEYESVSATRFRDYYFIVAEQGPFYIEGFEATINVNGNIRTLREGVDFDFALEYVAGTRIKGKLIYGAITLNNLELNGIVEITYKKVEDLPRTDKLFVLTRLAEMAYNPRITVWDLVTNVPDALPPTPHMQDYDTMFGQNAVIDKLDEISKAILENSTITTSHIRDLLGYMGMTSFEEYLSRHGDTIDGPLKLNYTPTEREHAIPKKYVDDNFPTNDKLAQELANLANSDAMEEMLKTKLNISGGTMTGSLYLHSDPTEDSEAVTKRYLDTFSATVNQKLSEIHSTLESIENIDIETRLENLEQNTFTKKEVLSLLGELTARNAYTNY